MQQLSTCSLILPAASAPILQPQHPVCKAEFLWCVLVWESDLKQPLMISPRSFCLTQCLKVEVINHYTTDFELTTWRLWYVVEVPDHTLVNLRFSFCFHEQIILWSQLFLRVWINPVHLGKSRLMTNMAVALNVRDHLQSSTDSCQWLTHAIRQSYVLEFCLL